MRAIMFQVFGGGYGLAVEALRLIWQERRGVLRLLVPIFALSLLLRLTGRMFLGPVQDIEFTFAWALFALGEVALYLLMAVLWHRLVLLPGAVWPPLAHLARYLGWFIAVLLALLPVMLLASVAGYWSFSLGIDGALAALYLMQGAYGLALGFLALRLGLVLPAAAVGGQETGLRWSWRKTAPLAAPLFGYALGELCLYTLLVAAEGALALQNWRVGLFFGAGVAAFFALLRLAVLSLLYRRLAGPEGFGAVHPTQISRPD